MLQQHKELGISEQIDYQKFYLDSLISNSVALSDLSPEPIETEMVDKQDLQKKMVDKWSIKPSLAEKLVDILHVLGIPECDILQISTFAVFKFGTFDFFVYFCTIYLNIYEIQN